MGSMSLRPGSEGRFEGFCGGVWGVSGVEGVAKAGWRVSVVVYGVLGGVSGW